MKRRPDRWVKFQKEYGTYEESRSRFGRALQATKYGIDTLTFTAQEAAKKLELSYTFGENPQSGPANSAPGAQHSFPLFGSFGHPQIKTVLAQHDPQTSTAFVGLKLSIPFGPGEQRRD